jgi:hydroxymethylglutaryl-CoA lyase
VTAAVEIVEVGPRDGLQNEARVLDIEDRRDFAARLIAAGARRLELVSFVNPRRVPQMAGAEALMEAVPAQPGLSRIGLVLNLRGFERCLASGCEEANVVICATDGFGVRNQGAPTEAQLTTLAAVMARRAAAGGPPVTATISVAFGCPFDGEVAEAAVARIAERCAALGVEEIALADTIGVADPWTVTKRVRAVRAAAPGPRLRLHFHDTRRAALANAYAGLEAGVDVLDASCGGLGGCPFAPNATGNLATEDLVFMLERAGIATGYDLDALIATAGLIGRTLGKPPASAVSRAGPFRPEGASAS